MLGKLLDACIWLDDDLMTTHFKLAEHAQLIIFCPIAWKKVGTWKRTKLPQCLRRSITALYVSTLCLCGYLSVGQWGEYGAVKQWEMTSLLCAHCLPANRAFQNRKSGWSTRSFFWFVKRSTTNGWNGKIPTVPGLQEQLQTALILSVTFIWSYQWVGLNVLLIVFWRHAAIMQQMPSNSIPYKQSACLSRLGG